MDLTVAKVKAANPAFEDEDISNAAKSFFAKMVAADSYKPALKVRGLPICDKSIWFVSLAFFLGVNKDETRMSLTVLS